MIYICYGMTKSASTFLYQLTERIFELSGLQPVRLKPPLVRKGSIDNDFGDIDEVALARVADEVGDRNVVLKTHGRLTPVVADRINKGGLFASVAVRDPREIALSMLDHGDRARRWRLAAFSEFIALEDTLKSLDGQVVVAGMWAAVPRSAVFRYNDICFDTAGTIARICQQIGVQLDPGDVMAGFRGGGAIGQFSKGVPLRYRELRVETQQLFLKRYAAFYAAFEFDTPGALAALAERNGDTRPVRARGELAQEITYWRRRLRL